MNWKRGVARIYLALWAAGFLILVGWATVAEHRELRFSLIAQTIRDHWQPLFFIGAVAPGTVFLLGYWVIRGFSKGKENK